MTLKKEHSKLVNYLCKELQEGRLSIFAGAGLSVEAGFVDWQGLLRPIAEDIGLDVERESDDLALLAQYHCNYYDGNKNKLIQILLDNFSQEAKPTKKHEILAQLPIYTYWTTNYDKLIENSLKDMDKNPDVKSDVDHLPFTKSKRDAIVYKMHGDIGSPEKIVITKEDYEKYKVKNKPFLDALSNDLISTSFLFLGCGFKDQNLIHVLSTVNLIFGKTKRTHYYIIKKAQKKDFSLNAEYNSESESAKQDSLIRELERYGVKPIIVNEYEEITEILEAVKKKHSFKKVFISGAISDYEDKSAEDINKFISCLSGKVSTEDFNIISGFGLGVGDSVITGALRYIYSQGTASSAEQLILRPFPQNPKNPKEWTKYREHMLSTAGIAIFLFGNKLENGNIVLSDGMKEEFEIAKENGVFLLPVGATGYMAKELWEEVNNNFEKLNGQSILDESKVNKIKNNFESLGDESLPYDKITEIVMSILTELKQ